MQVDATHKKYLLTIVGIILVLGIATYVIVSSTTERERRENADVARLVLDDGSSPFTTLEGESVDIESNTVSLRVVTTWASWCPSCGGQLVLFDEVATLYADVAVLAVNRNENPSIAKAYIETLPPLRHVRVLLDTHDHFFKAVEGYTMPETILYDADGLIVTHMRGAVTRERLIEVIDNALENKN